MASSYRLSSGMSADFPVAGVKLTHLQARVWGWLTTRAHLKQGICQATRTIAAAFGCSVRSIQLVLKFFRDLGVLDREFDYELRTRRRYFLATPPTNSFGATDCADSAQPVAPTSVPPLEPPIEVSGEGEGLGCGGAGSPPPGIVEASAPEEIPASPEATPEEAAKLVEAAAKVFPDQAPRLVAELARKWAPDWIRAAIKRAVTKRDAGGDVVPGYLIGCLKGFASDGGPPAELTAPERGRDEVMRLFMEAFERA